MKWSSLITKTEKLCFKEEKSLVGSTPGLDPIKLTKNFL